MQLAPILSPSSQWVVPKLMLLRLLDLHDGHTLIGIVELAIHHNFVQLERERR